MSRAGETENCWERRQLVRIEPEARNGKPQIRQIHQCASHAQAGCLRSQLNKVFAQGLGDGFSLGVDLEFGVDVLQME